MRITLDQYFRSKDHSIAQERDALVLLARVDLLLGAFERDTRLTLVPDPDTGTLISGTKNGAGDGGFRTPDSTTGSPGSAHRAARAVDVYDPKGLLDSWINNERLVTFDLYREAGSATPGWCHLTTRAPASGNRSFQP